MDEKWRGRYPRKLPQPTVPARCFSWIASVSIRPSETAKIALALVNPSNLQQFSYISMARKKYE
jgi:hypothetical protein